MGSRHSIARLVQIHGGICHYCKDGVSNASKRRAPTRDHIVPKAFGGPNSLDNYVLACVECNGKRGTTLFYCKCRDCLEKIYDFLYDPDSLAGLFDGIIGHNKPIIRKAKMTVAGRGKWEVRVGYRKKFMFTFEQALNFALTQSFTEDKEYK